MIRVEHLKKYFNTKRGILHAVDNINFSINEGKTLGVVGESGCGKSTLGRVLIGLLNETSGTITFDGQVITGKRKRSHELITEMQMIFQDPFSSLDPRKTVYDQIADPIRINHICKNRKEVDEKVSELMDTVGLAKRLTFSYPHELDGGRRQRIGVARALAVDPRFIVCDEPVSALDVSIQAQILNLLMDLQDEKGITYVFITHDLSVVKHISTDIMVMYVGCMVEKSESQELFEHPLHPYTKGLLSAVPIPSINVEKKRVLMKGELTSPINPAPGCRFAKRCPFAKDRCFREDPEYREIRPNHFAACHYVEAINEIS